jgi:hypothetical protein
MDGFTKAKEEGTMNRSVKFLLVTATVLVAILGFAGEFYAHHLGLAQFISIRGGRTHGTKIINPGRLEQFSVAIVYNDDESFQFCQGFNITPHGMAFVDSLSSQGSVEIISAVAGTRTGGTLLPHHTGVTASTGKGRVGVHIDIPLFSITDSDALSCVCTALSDAGESPLLFLKLGIKC